MDGSWFPDSCNHGDCGVINVTIIMCAKSAVYMQCSAVYIHIHQGII